MDLLCLGQSDFDAILNRRTGPAFRELIQVAKVPSGEWLRQRLEHLAERGLAEHVHGLNVDLLTAAQVPSRKPAMSAWTWMRS